MLAATRIAIVVRIDLITVLSKGDGAGSFSRPVPILLRFWRLRSFGRLIRRLQPPFGSTASFLRSVARAEGSLVLLHCGVTFVLQIENTAQVNVRPCHGVRVLG